MLQVLGLPCRPQVQLHDYCLWNSFSKPPLINFHMWWILSTCQIKRTTYSYPCFIFVHPRSIQWTMNQAPNHWHTLFQVNTVYMTITSLIGKESPTHRYNKETDKDSWPQHLQILKESVESVHRISDDLFMSVEWDLGELAVFASWNFTPHLTTWFLPTEKYSNNMGFEATARKAFSKPSCHPVWLSL